MTLRGGASQKEMGGTNREMGGTNRGRWVYEPREMGVRMMLKT